MPRYFFNLRNDVDADDLEGMELPHVAAAREQAARFAVDVAAAAVLECHKIDLRHRIDVVDESGETLFAVKFGDVIAVET